MFSSFIFTTLNLRPKQRKQRRTTHVIYQINMGKKSLNTSEAAEALDASQVESGLSYEEKLKFVNRIAQPMASKKLAKKLMKMIKKGSKHKGQIRNGLKDVQTRLRKGDTGIVVFAGDVTPEDIMCHLPAVCEDKSIPYVYVASKEDIGSALGRKKGCIMALIQAHDEYTDAFQECSDEIKRLPLPV